jgi:hypothetical protein
MYYKANLHHRFYTAWSYIIFPCILLNIHHTKKMVHIKVTDHKKIRILNVMRKNNLLHSVPLLRNLI